MRYFAAWAAAGTHTLSYEAIAATRGDFVLPPAKVRGRALTLTLALILILTLALT